MRVPLPPPTARFENPVRVLLSLLAVFAPIPLAMVIALAVDVEALALGGVLTSWLLGWRLLRRRGSSWGAVGFSGARPTARTVGIAAGSALLLLIVTSIASQLLAALTGWVPDISRFDVVRGNVAALAGGLVVVWTTASFGEEMLFRGILLNDLAGIVRGRRSVAWVSALVVSSVAFGVAHAYQGAAGVVLTGIVGFGIGLVYVASSRNMWAAILTHGFYDTVGFVLVFASLDRIFAPSLAVIGALPRTC